MAQRDDVGDDKTSTRPIRKSQAAPPAPSLAVADAGADAHLEALFEDFFVARKPLKGSPHTEAAYRGDLAAISAHLAADLGTEPEELRLGQVTAKSLRRAFAAYSDNHAAASIARAWAAWNQFFGFLVADEVVVGNPMAAVAKPKVPARAPKALQGEGTPERLLQAVAAGERHAAAPLARARPRLRRHGAAHGPSPLRAARPGPGLYRRPGGRTPPKGHRQGLQGPLRADRGPPRDGHHPLPLHP